MMVKILCVISLTKHLLCQVLYTERGKEMAKAPVLTGLVRQTSCEEGSVGQRYRSLQEQSAV